MRESLDTPLVTAYDDVDVVCCLDDEASEVAEVVVPQRDDLTGERAPACMVVALFVVALFSMATKWGNCGFSLFLARPDRQFAPVLARSPQRRHRN